MTATFQSLTHAFDAVVMLTWSDWRTEPRSNRYHYATRFARAWPVYFVQFTEAQDGNVCEPLAGSNINIVHIGSSYGQEQSDRLQALLKSKGVLRPLYWVYNPHFLDFIESYPPQLLVYHATEDYLGDHPDLQLGDPIVAKLHRLLAQTDLAVAVTETVAAGVRKGGRYGGPLIVARNGCDVEHWKVEAKQPPSTEKVALFQGGINARLDYDLLLDLADRLPDWRFWFCGGDTYATQPQWSDLKAKPNVRWLGEMHADQLPDIQAQATVGLIPFRQTTLMRASLPLKAYEYVASGLPVVTIPIDELSREPDLFLVATDSKSFALKLEEAAATRHDAGWLDRREKSAAAASYDSRFDAMTEKLGVIVEARARSNRQRNVLVLYDHGSTHVATLREHLESLDRYSAHHIHYLPATPTHAGAAPDLDFSMFDVVVVHYSVRLSVPAHLIESAARALERFSGLKIAFLQDEYETTDIARAWLKRLQIDVLFTCIPMEDIEKIYPKAEFGWMKIVPTLTGYVPDDAEVEIHRRPMRDRKIVIGYRGRRLFHHYGELGQEKLRIGLEVRQQAVARGIPVDIEVDEHHRIYGAAWYEFLATARATLGTESGSNVFDFDGSLARATRANSKMSYEEYRQRFLIDREGFIRMNQISPKIFEAIRLRVALVLFEGEYSGVVKPNLHYIPLKKDLSNIEDVFAKLDDIPLLEAMTERAYRDVVEDERYSYRAFAADVDLQILNGLGLQRSRSTIVSVPAYVLRNNEFRSYPLSAATMPADTLLPSGVTPERFLELLGLITAEPVESPVIDKLDEPPETAKVSEAARPSEPATLREPVTIVVEPIHRIEIPNRSRLSATRERLKENQVFGAILAGVGRMWDRAPQRFKALVRRVIH